MYCEQTFSPGYDPTGENAVECGRPAGQYCFYCGAICSTCAQEICQGPNIEHEFVVLSEVA